MTTKTIERVNITKLENNDIVVLGTTELQLTEVDDAGFDLGYVRLYFKGDHIGVNFHRSGTINRIKKVELVNMPFGTVVKTRFGDTGVKTKEYGWIAPDRTDRWSHWNDEVVSGLIRSGVVTVLFTPEVGR